MQEWQGINKTDAAALAGRFGLACPVYQIMVVSTALSTTKLLICRSLAGVARANQEAIVSATKALPGFEVEELN